MFSQDELSEALTEFTTRAVERLIQQKLMCKSIGVTIRSHRFQQQNYVRPYTVVHLEDYSDDLLKINQAVQQGLKHIFQAGYRYKKAGILLMDLIPHQHYACDLFTDQDARLRQQRLSNTCSEINQHYGKDRVVLAPTI